MYSRTTLVRDNSIVNPLGQVFAHIRHCVVRPTGVRASERASVRERVSQIFMIKVDAIPGQWEDRANGSETNEIAATDLWALWRQNVAISAALSF